MIDRRHNLLLRIGSNIGADVTVALNIIDGSRKPVGNAQVRMSADFDLDQQLEGGEAVEQDPLNLNHLEQIMPGNKGKSVLQVTTGSRPHSRPGNGTLIGKINRSSQQFLNAIAIFTLEDSDTCGYALRNVISVLRGDGGKHFVDTLTGNIDVDDFRRSSISIHKETVSVMSSLRYLYTGFACCYGVVSATQRYSFLKLRRDVEQSFAVQLPLII